MFACSRDASYGLDTDTGDIISDLLNFYGLHKWGFVVYRCTYGDDDAWARFMDQLNRCTTYDLVELYDKADLANRLDWNVQQDPALEGASKDEVCRRFREWVDSDDAKSESPLDAQGERLHSLLAENPRYNYCIHVDAGCIRSVLECERQSKSAEPPRSSYVNIVRADSDWIETYGVTPSAPEYRLDEGEEEVEGSRLYDVGWMKAPIRGLVPEVYSILRTNHRWDHLYCRPPNEMMRL